MDNMGKYDKLQRKILLGSSDSNINFAELCRFLIRLGFIERVRGDHHIFSREDLEEIINIQPIGSKAKAYQVKQVRDIIVRYQLGLKDAE